METSGPGFFLFSSVQSLSSVRLFVTPMDCSTPGLLVHYQLPEFTQTHAHWVSDAIQPSHPLWSPSPPAFNLSQHQGLFKWVSSSHQVAKYGVSALTSVLPMNTQDWSPLGWTGCISLQSRGLSRVSSNTTVQKHQFFSAQLSFSLSFFFLVFLVLIYFNWRLITLQYCGGFCHTFTWISHGCTCVPHPEPPSHFPPHPIPQGHPSAPAPSCLSHALNLDWWSSSHIIIYMFQCYSLKSSHPCLLPWSSKVCSLHLGFFCCLTYRVIVTIFLNSTYMH